jgi:peptidoglycan/xylan/chitin deacetylase (PgdA/CDA1 family)
MMLADPASSSTGQAGPGAVILMYHRVARIERDPWGMCVSPENFAGQMDCIRRVANPMGLRDWVHGHENGCLPERAVVVTFDDGYVDNLLNALPILETHQVPATVFVSTANIDSDREFWWDRIESLLLGTGELPERLELSLGAERKRWELGSARAYTAEQSQADVGIFAWCAAPGTRLAFFFDVWKALWPLPGACRAEAIDQLALWAGSDPGPDTTRRTMGSAELRQLAQGGLVEIGAHTVDHPPLSAHDAEFQAEQILPSRAQLERVLGFPVTSFAYPHGENSDETVDILRRAGFRCAVTIKQQLARAQSDVMRLPRFGARNIAEDAFEHQLETWFREG